MMIVRILWGVGDRGVSRVGGGSCFFEREQIGMGEGGGFSINDVNDCSF